MKDSATRFYLSGGTALSRGYFNHRYSDDIDLFLENDPSFKEQSEKLISTIQSRGYEVETSDIVVSEDFISFSTGHQNLSNTNLKVDLINDTAKRFGELIKTSVFHSTDNWRNILSNKLCALLRLEAKDFADIWIISRNKQFNWGQLLDEAREKEMGLDPAVLAELMNTIPGPQFQTIRWIEAPPWKEFRGNFNTISLDMLNGNDNSLYTRNK